MASPAADDEVPDEIRLGSVLVSLLDPERGREAEFHRWYERDHFYAGCMVGAHFFAGRRFVATSALKDQRLPERDALFDDVRDGSYLALYWILDGRHEAAERWAVDRVQSLIAHDRMMPGRRPVHAGFYTRRISVERDADGVPVELALDHPFAGVGLCMVEAPGAAERDSLLRELESRHLPELLEGSDLAMVIGLTPLRLPDDAPSYVERADDAERRVLLLAFFQDPRGASLRRFSSELAARLAAEGGGRLSLSAPFVPTIPGTDRYADELW